ncbi:MULTISPECIES: ABC transporter ATP-binding protein [Kocuria]|uniref:ABC transporter ATP-binding protein n=1 Tax=Kocuria TaxID=57493 RepID=UPI001EF53E00|nr:MULTISPECIES: ATP-binding cassette domain-containing protein [Kocuria]MCG7424799.1 ATP-binding cassette domain-containing protein [Kocuria rhizophila]MCT1544537.1 ATP-binding cassette domain-containing protein [Kocuria rhizophila]MCT2170811.1 ATP-binding cassette domain-containing protein [Kocuria rhizophila]MCT2249273.1 ATP-binding cassette domain-containing protein [Kocuria rhizophila]MDA4828632.1 ATP-binding cassette domain-containing protein [Kocuria rhizophila]
MPSTIVATENLTKRYGQRSVVENLNLRIPEGCVYGFLGPNGAGKSTTMKMLLSLIQPTSGEVHVMGRPMTRGTRRELLGRIGSLIEAPPGYAHLTGAENMRLVQRMLGLNSQQIDYAVRAVRLQDQMDKKVRNYSLGMKQRLGIAMALARQPKLLILDEPTNGLDPAGIEEMRVLLRRLANDGVTVMVSSHLLGEIDKTANVLGILSGGRIIFQGLRSELMAASSPDVIIACSNPHAATTTLRSYDARLTADDEVAVPGLGDRQTAGIVAALVGSGVGIYGVRREEQTLEDVFMTLTAGGGL